MDVTPQVCVIIPSRNEAKSIRTCLDAVMAQDYPKDSFQVLVVDGVSTDGTCEILAEYESQYPFFGVVESPRKVVSPGFNMAVNQTQADIIVRVDGHTVIAPDYVSKCVEHLLRSGADNVGGKMYAVSTTPFGQAVAYATSTPFGVGGSRFHYSDKEEWVDSVYLGAWPRQVFVDNGLFDEELVRDQDDEFNYRLRENGGKILLSPEIHSEYTVRSDATSLAQQYGGYGFWKVRVLQKHPRQMSPRQFAPPLLVLALIFSALLGLFTLTVFSLTLFMHRLLGILSVVVPFLYLAANLLASVYTAAKRGWRYLIYLPLVFAIMHLSYGGGFLVGLVKFRRRWGDKKGRTPFLS